MSKEPERSSLGEYELSEKAHGTHGKGDMREHEIGERAPAPANPRVKQIMKHPEQAADKMTGELADGGWGSAGAGDSSVDARSKKHKGSGGT
jgi:hypothetical protein